MAARDHRRVRTCRVCRSSELPLVLSLGEMPLANALVAPEDLDARERRFPLDVLRCGDCGLMQLSVVVKPEILFGNYVYSSSASMPLLQHFDSYADDIAGRFVSPGGLVVEIGSNDGVLLRPLAARGLRVVGVEPAANMARLARSAGLETRNDFFGLEVARAIRRERGAANAVLANNVLAHIDDLDAALRALDELLDEDGVFVVEVPYLVDLLANVEYDTIYHEHLSYFALGPLERLVSRHGLAIFDVQRLPVHGGSIRVFAARRGSRPVTGRADQVLEDEGQLARLGEPRTYDEFVSRVCESRDALRQLLAELRAQGKRIAGFGATAKGNTMLNYCGIGPEQLEFIADSTPQKLGLLTPGTHIPIRPERAILDEHPDFALLLAWNYAEAIARRFTAYSAAGGRFIHPIPLARVLEP